MPTSTFTPLATTTLATTTTNIVFSSIPQTYKSLIILGSIRMGDSSNNVPLQVYINNTSSGYINGGIRCNNTTFTFTSSGNSRFNNSAGDSSPANVFSPIQIEFPFYTDTTFRKEYTGMISNVTPSLNNHVGMETIQCWSQTSAISTITLASAFGGGFVAKSIVTLYGLSG